MLSLPLFDSDKQQKSSPKKNLQKQKLTKKKGKQNSKALCHTYIVIIFLELFTPALCVHRAIEPLSLCSKALLSTCLATQLALQDLPLSTLTVRRGTTGPCKVSIAAPLHHGSTAHGQQRFLQRSTQRDLGTCVPIAGVYAQLFLPLSLCKKYTRFYWILLVAIASSSWETKRKIVNNKRVHDITMQIVAYDVYV